MAEIKRIIVESALKLGFQRAVVAGLAPMDLERRFFETWLAQGYAASQDYLKRDPAKRNSPQQLFPQAKSAILLFASYYTEPPPDPGPEYGKVARYAVGLDYHTVLKEKLANLKETIENKLGRKILANFFSDDVELFEQGLAARHGLGFTGKHSLLIGPKLMGSYHFLAELFTDLELEPDQKYEGSCGKCTRCADICPTQAIVADKTIDSALCISFLTIENRGAIPLNLREKLGSWVFGCDLCQEICPYNQKPPEATFEEFFPESGAGHYLNLFDLLKIDSKASFLSLFGKSAISRARRRGLLRNALVVLGNRLPPAGAKHILEFLDRENDLLLLEHGLWAFNRFGEEKKLLHDIYAGSGPEKRQLLDAYI